MMASSPEAAMALVLLLLPPRGSQERANRKSAAERHSSRTNFETLCGISTRIALIKINALHEVLW